MREPSWVLACCFLFPSEIDAIVDYTNTIMYFRDDTTPFKLLEYPLCIPQWDKSAGQTAGNPIVKIISSGCIWVPSKIHFCNDRSLETCIRPTETALHFSMSEAIWISSRTKWDRLSWSKFSPNNRELTVPTTTGHVERTKIVWRHLVKMTCILENNMQIKCIPFKPSSEKTSPSSCGFFI